MTSVIADENKALEAVALKVSYNHSTVLRGLDLCVRQGEVYALLNGNGAGKSTTLNAFLGFVQPASGTVRVCGHDVGRETLKARSNIAYVPENVALYEHLTARENIDYLLHLAGAIDVTASTIDNALESVGLERAARDRRLSVYSKGMRQKVAIALALARSVPVLLLDEPNTGLDPQATRELNRLLQSLRDQRVAVFMVTHDLLSAADIADRIGFLGQGKIIEEFQATGPDRFDVQALYRRYAQESQQA